MRLKSIKLSNFRNYECLDLDFQDGIYVFYGDNAQGKTNLLEAIFLCTCARSHRTGRDDELINHGKNFYKVVVEFITERGFDEKVMFSYFLPSAGKASRSKRKMSYNDIEVENVSDMIGLFHAVIFAPEDLQIVKGSPSERRRFLDILISQTNRPYFRALQRYNNVLSQRNSLLKIIRDRLKDKKTSHSRISSNIADQEAAGDNKLDEIQLPQLGPKDELAVWDKALAEEAAFILKKRLDYVEKIAHYAGFSLKYLTDSSEEIKLRYKCLAGISHENTEEEIFQKFFQRLQNTAEDDVWRGSTSFGPHRDDLEIDLNDFPARTYASQGQQRSLVLSLKISEAFLLWELTGEKPILLLDDVMSELDASRRERLLNLVKGHQVFLTGTDKEQMFDNSEYSSENKNHTDIHFFYVEAGTVTAD